MDDIPERQRFADVQFETECYNNLVSDSGRPSHPINLLEAVVSNPGQYREILSFWQDHPDEWRVFRKQLERWRDFRHRQRFMREHGQFAEYAAVTKDRLARHDFTQPFQLHEDPNQQDRLTTWIEYLNYEYRIHNGHVRLVNHDQQRYNDAWKKLANSNVLDASETENSICRAQGILERIREENKRLTAEKDVNLKKGRVHFITNGLQGLKRPRRDIQLQRLTTAKAELDKAEGTLSALKRRTDCIAEFMQETTRYRSEKGEAERCTIVLRWILEQVPLIELELNPPKTSMHKLDGEANMRHSNLESPSRVDRYDPAFLPSPRPMWTPVTVDDVYCPLSRYKKFAASLNSDSTSTAPTFHLFQRLPNEIRFRIWEICLPPRPTVHFFDVINHPLAQHHQHLWSNKDFRLRASRDHESGYLHVLPLMGTCKEARAVVASYYRRPNPACLAPARSNTSKHSQRNPAPLDWIPQDDLVVLCLPPRQDSRFPATHDITLAGRPHVGFAVPFELLDCVNVQAAPLLLLRELACSKLPQTYLLSRLQAFEWFPSACGSWIQREVHWSGSGEEWRGSAFRPWERVIGADVAEQRRFWWVGGDGYAAVGMARMGDVVGGMTFGKMLGFQWKVDGDGQRHWGPGFCDMESLGWMVEGRLSGSGRGSDEGD